MRLLTNLETAESQPLKLLQQRQSERARKRKAPPEPDSVAAVSTHEQLAILRRELNGLVAAWHHRTGQAHGITHAALRKECGGPVVSGYCCNRCGSSDP